MFLICVRLSRLPRLPFGKKILNPIFLVSGLLLVNNGIDLIPVLQAFGGLKLPLCHFKYISTDVSDKQCNECGCCSKKIKTDDSRMVWYGMVLNCFDIYERHYFS